MLGWVRFAVITERSQGAYNGAFGPHPPHPNPAPPHPRPSQGTAPRPIRAPTHALTPNPTKPPTLLRSRCLHVSDFLSPSLVSRFRPNLSLLLSSVSFLHGPSPSLNLPLCLRPCKFELCRHPDRSGWGCSSSSAVFGIGIQRNRSVLFLN